MSKQTHVILTVALWIIFFVVQVLVLLELPLTILAVALCVVLLARRVAGEVQLFIFGVAMALIIELGLGLIARSQHWDHASLFGIPYWLPLIWGYGFVVMRRIGNLIVEYFGGPTPN